MSRYSLRPKLPDAEEVVVGWDRPLRNFFGHVYSADHGPEAEECLVAEYAISSLEKCLDFAVKYATDFSVAQLRELLAEDMTAVYPSSNRALSLWRRES